MAIDNKIRDEKAKFSYSSLGKVFIKQKKTVEDQRKYRKKTVKEHKNNTNLIKKKNYCFQMNKKYLRRITLKDFEKKKKK